MPSAWENEADRRARLRTQKRSGPVGWFLAGLVVVYIVATILAVL